MRRAEPSVRARATALATGAILVVAIAPTAAQAEGCVGRPGASALEQYCEAVPSANGGRQKANQGSNGGGSKPYSSSTVKSLADAGADGAAVAALAAGAASNGTSDSDLPKSSSKPNSSTTDSSGPDASGETATDESTQGVSDPAAPDASPLTATKEAVATGPTAGPALTWGVLGMSAIGAIGAIVLRRRRLHDVDATTAGDSASSGDE